MKNNKKDGVLSEFIYTVKTVKIVSGMEYNDLQKKLLKEGYYLEEGSYKSRIGFNGVNDGCSEFTLCRDNPDRDVHFKHEMFLEGGDFKDSVVGEMTGVFTIEETSCFDIDGFMERKHEVESVGINSYRNYSYRRGRSSVSIYPPTNEFKRIEFKCLEVTKR